MDSTYPKWMYSKDGAKLIESAADAKKLGPGWFENPSLEVEAPKAAKAAAAPAPKTPKQEYPKFLYRADGESVFVANADEHKKLAAGYFESPDEARADAAKAKDVKPAPTKKDEKKDDKE